MTPEMKKAKTNCTMKYKAKAKKMHEEGTLADVAVGETVILLTLPLHVY